MSNKKTSIGGQALIEGIMMRGPEKTAMSVRNAKGKIITEVWDTKINSAPKFFRIPIIRGIYSMITSYSTGYKCLMRSADISLADIEEEEKAKEKSTESAAEVNDQAQSAQTAASTPVSDDASAEPYSPEEKPESENRASDGESADTAIVPAADDSTEKKKTKEKKENSSENQGALVAASVIGIVLGLALSIFLFIFLPSLLSKFIVGANTETLTAGQIVLRSAIEGVTKIAILVVYMLIVSQMKEIKRMFMYHGAEHKTIFCYEQGLELTVENVRKQRRFHPRCGTSFMILMLIVGIIIGFFIRMDNVLLRTFVRIALLPLTIGIGYELIKFAGRHDNILTRIISAPGVWLQHITTKEPDDSMIECAITAMNVVIPEDKTKDNW